MFVPQVYFIEKIAIFIITASKDLVTGNPQTDAFDRAARPKFKMSWLITFDWLISCLLYGPKKQLKVVLGFCIIRNRPVSITG